MSNCATCGENAEIGVNCLLSTRRIRPRAQKCSRSILFCGPCLRVSRSCDSAELARCLLESLYEAYTAIAEPKHARIEGAE
jgi:hypothetical protein